MSKTSSSIINILLASFVLWYLLRRTNLGQAYSSDMYAIPQQLGVAEGLKSAANFMR